MNFIYLAVISFFAFFASVHPAAANDIFTISNIEVVEKSDNAKQAKDNAIAKAQQEAFKKLLARVSTSPESQWPVLSSGEIGELVQGFDVVKEKVTPKRYEGTLNITFNHELIEKLLQVNKINFITKTSEPIILLPVLSLNGENLLWDSSNSWHNAWKKQLGSSGFAQLIIPKGDDSDVSLVNLDRILSGEALSDEDKSNLSKLMNKYRSKNILLAKATRSGDEQTIEVQVELTYLNEEKPMKTTNKFSGQTGTDTLDKVMANAVSSIINAIDADWKKEQEGETFASTLININVPIASVEEWNAIYKRLGGLDFIKGMNAKYVTVSYASLDLRYQGDYDSFLKRLEKEGLTLEKNSNGFFLKKYSAASKQDEAAHEFSR
jgi:hypothetical protein